jgi:hypothetical protein
MCCSDEKKMHMIESWDFYQDLQSHWHWLAVLPSGTLQSRTSFPSRNECIVDAMRHGYLAVVPDAMRCARPSRPAQRHASRKTPRRARRKNGTSDQMTLPL